MNGLIYYILNKENNKLYIGQTFQSFSRRKYVHLYNLKNNLHHNRYLQRTYKKYGKGVFSFAVLESGIESIIELNNAEIFWIQNLKSLYPHGYNLESGGENYIRHKQTNDLLVKLKSNIVYQYDLDGNFIREWGGCVKTPYNPSGVSSACRGELITFCDYQWRYKKDNPPKQINKAKKIKRNINPHTKSIRVYNLNGSFIKDYDNIISFCEQYNFNTANASSAIKRKGRIGNFQLRYLTNNTPIKIKKYTIKNKTPVLQFSLCDEFLKEYESCTEAKNSLNVNSISAIYNCASGKSKTAYKYKWRFKYGNK